MMGSAVKRSGDLHGAHHMGCSESSSRGSSLSNLGQLVNFTPSSINWNACVQFRQQPNIQ